MDKKRSERSAAVVAVALPTAVALVGFWLFWTFIGSDGVASVALGAFGLVLGLTASGAAARRVVRLWRPGMVEQDDRLVASGRYREPGPFRVRLDTAGPRPIQAVKAIREVTGLDLDRAQAMASAAPTLVAEGVSAESADCIAGLLRDAGASVCLEDCGPAPSAAAST